MGECTEFKNIYIYLLYFQTLTRSANPLGKLMDFLQEDVDSMQRELETWRNENRELQSKLRYGSLLDNAPNCLSGIQKKLLLTFYRGKTIFISKNKIKIYFISII